MSNLLVPRSDTSEFRKRYRWLALAAFGLLVIGKVPPVLVVALASGAGWLLTP